MAEAIGNMKFGSEEKPQFILKEGF